MDLETILALFDTHGYHYAIFYRDQFDFPYYDCLYLYSSSFYHDHNDYHCRDVLHGFHCFRDVHDFHHAHFYHHRPFLVLLVYYEEQLLVLALEKEVKECQELDGLLAFPILVLA